MKSRWAIWLVLFIFICIIFNNQEWKKNIYIVDNLGYYLYLPAVFIYHDLGTLSFLPTINEKYGALPDGGRWFIYDGQDEKKNDKYSIGTCLFELPLFFAAHIFCLASRQYVADGFSMPYQWAGVLSCILWAIAGMFVLRKFLSNYFDDFVVAVTILCIALGTNLYYFTAYDQGSSHPYSFFLFSCVLYCTHLWYKHLQKKYLYILGLLLGLVTITRPINILVAIIPFFWEVYNYSSLKERVRSFKLYKNSIALYLFIFMCVVFLQLLYWKYTVGHWLYFSYKEEGFDFLHPRIFKGLFSYRKGWFIYTPVAFTSLIIGTFALFYKNKKILPVITVFFLLFIYAVFSWKNWWYGSSFSCRPLIESLAVLSLPLAAMVEKVLSQRRILLSLSFFILLVGCIVLNVFQSYQFSIGIIHCDRMSKEYYWHVFGKTEINPNDYEKYLMDEHEYWEEIKRISH